MTINKSFLDRLFRKSTLTMCVLLMASFTAESKEITVGSQAESVNLSGDLGGTLDGAPWTSTSMIGHVTSLFYIDPEEKDKNEPLEKMYEKEKFPFETHKTVAVINMAAAWYPNSAIESVLAKKQKQYSKTVYVKDKKKTLVEKWALKDDSINLVVFDKTGKVIYLSKGPVSPEDYPTLVATIRKALE
jgi:predicted transcriptional regulator